MQSNYVEKSPCWGRIFERIIKSVKKMIGNSKLSMVKLIVEIISIIIQVALSMSYMASSHLENLMTY